MAKHGRRCASTLCWPRRKRSRQPGPTSGNQCCCSGSVGLGCVRAPWCPDILRGSPCQGKDGSGRVDAESRSDKSAVIGGWPEKSPKLCPSQSNSVITNSNRFHADPHALCAMTLADAILPWPNLGLCSTPRPANQHPPPGTSFPARPGQRRYRAIRRGPQRP